MLDDIKQRIQGLIFQVQLTWLLLRDERVPLWTKTIPLLVLVYVVSPIDFIPDVILALGQIDDLLILTLGLNLFERMAPEMVVREYRHQLENSL